MKEDGYGKEWRDREKQSTAIWYVKVPLNSEMG